MFNLKFLGFARESSSAPILGHALQLTLQQPLKQEVKKVLARLKQLQLKKQQRQRITSDFGVWFCKKDDKGFFFFALCISSYPERHIYAAINEVRTHLGQIGDYSSEPDSTLKLHAKGKLVQICEKYNNLKQLDKIGEANKLLSDIKDDISDSTRKLLDNQVNLEGLHKKAEDMKENAQIFETSSAAVEREMWCRNCKMKVIIAVVVVALICVIVIPIVTTANK